MERLVGFGVDMNVQDNDGDTALHIAVSKELVVSLNTETPQLKKVESTVIWLFCSLWMELGIVIYSVICVCKVIALKSLFT